MTRILLFLFVLFLAGFSDHLNASPNRQSVQQQTAVTITQLGPKRSGPRWSLLNYSGLKERVRLVVRDKEAWLDVWKRVQCPGSTPSPLPDVDFTQEMLIVVALGEQSTGGYGIIVDSAYARNNQLEINVISYSVKGCGQTQALTQPVDIVRLPRTNNSVVFRETEAIKNCLDAFKSP